jgi:hypothetical protein
MPRTTAKKPTTKPRPKKAKPATSAANKQAQPEAERPTVTATGYAAGELVSHPLFGPGTVTAVEADKLTIKFADGQVKQIVNYYLSRRTRQPQRRAQQRIAERVGARTLGQMHSLQTMVLGGLTCERRVHCRYRSDEAC